MNLGIAGNGQIVQEFLSIKDQIKNLNIVAICCRKRSEVKTKQLAQKHHIPLVETDYDVFLKNKDIDTVYVAVTNELHFEYAKKALQAGKNVIVEKPFTLTLQEGKQLYRLAGNKDRFLFEAITSIFTKGFHDIKENLPKLGPIRIVEANYSQYSTRYDDFKVAIIRPAFDSSKGGGALNDLNIYNLHMAYGLFGKPISAQYFGNFQGNVDTSGVAILRYPGFICSLIAAKDSFNDAYFNIQGEDAVMLQRTSANICGPFEIEDKSQEIEFFDGREYHDHRMVPEFNEFIRIINENDLNAYEKLEKQTLGVLEILEELKENTID